MPYSKWIQAQAQAIYFNLLLKKAAEQANALPDKDLAFDPQGRLLIDVSLSEKDLLQLTKELNEIQDIEQTVNPSNLNEALGINITPITSVSLDIANIPELNQKFENALKAKLIQAKANNPDKILRSLGGMPKGSIIALQQEFHFHLGLATRTYQSTFANLGERINPEKFNKAHQDTTKEVNDLILTAYAKALKNATDKNGKINSSKLNESLDKARKKISQDAHTLLMKNIVKHTGLILPQKLDKDALKHTAESLTATSNDVLHSESGLEVATFIERSEETSHNRKLGDFSHRRIITHPFSNGSVSANTTSRIQIRTPSLAVKEGLAGDESYIEDVKTKLIKTRREYHLDTQLSSDDKKPKAFIYNLFTAINDTFGDLNGNLQTQSTRHILQGIHRYNASELDKAGDSDKRRLVEVDYAEKYQEYLNQLQQYEQIQGLKDPLLKPLPPPPPYRPVFCFLQDISVNGFGDTLGYNSKDPLVVEATLMTEISLMHSLYDTASELEKARIGEVFLKYEKYLLSKPRSIYFSDSPEGDATKKLIQNIKNDWKATTANLPAPQNTVEHAKHALRKLMANDLHMQHNYSKLFQTLSVVVEEASLGGCKSGNERAKGINGRVTIFDSIIAKQKNRSLLGPDLEAIVTNLKLLSSAQDKDVEKAAKKLKLAVDRVYNARGLHTGVSIVGEVDQGASDKVEAMNGIRWPWKSRNYAEESDSIMTNLHQEKAGGMQAHKDLTKNMLSAWGGHQMSLWDRLKSSPLKTVGAVLAVLSVVGIFIGLARNAYDNNNRGKKALGLISQAKTEFDLKPVDLKGGSMRVMGENGLEAQKSKTDELVKSLVGTGADEFDEQVSRSNPVKPVKPVQPVQPVEPVEPVEPVQLELDHNSSKESSVPNQLFH